MTKTVKTVEVSELVVESVKLMKDNKIGSVVVTENRKPVGIFTERDLIRVVAEGHLKLKISEVMSKPLSIIAPTATLWDAIALMGRIDVRRLPVVDNGKLVGILTEKDLFRLIISQQNLVLQSVAEYLPATTRTRLQSLVTQFGGERPPSLH